MSFRQNAQKKPVHSFFFVDARLFFGATINSFAVMKVIEDVDSDDDSSSVRTAELHLETG